jgi:heterodisulfide reductase subunit B
MRRISYYPGCTLSTKGKGYDRSGRAVAAALGIELEELADWQCCGATFPLATDNSMALIAPTRVLYQAEQAGERVAALCAICYHVLRRTQTALERDPAMRDRINWFTEQEYQGRVRVVHLLEILRDDIGWEAIAQKVVRPLTGLRAAPYYGCLLLRPYAKSAWITPKPRRSCTT